MATALVNAPLSTKVTASEKDRFVEICERIGTTPANAMRMFVSAFTAGADFPSTPRTPTASTRRRLPLWTMPDAATSSGRSTALRP